jgi:hypothetical protein
MVGRAISRSDREVVFGALSAHRQSTLDRDALSLELQDRVERDSMAGPV